MRRRPQTFGDGGEARSERRALPAEGDRLPPHSLEAEQGVLGCCLLDPQEALGLAMERIGGREVFFDGWHGVLFRALTDMVNNGVPVDLIVLRDWLRDRGHDQAMEGRGGMPYLAGLQGCVAAASMVGTYVETLLGKYRLREMLRVCQQAMLQIYDEQERAPGEVVNEIETAVLSAGEAGATSTGVYTGQEVMRETVELVDNCFTRGAGIIDGVRTRFSYLDKMLGGLHNKEMIVIAARPSCGKTALMMNIAMNAAKAGEGGGIFSIEMARTALMLRAWCGEADVNMQQIRTGYGTNSDIKRLMGCAGRISKLALWFDDTSALDIGTFRARARRMKRLGAKWIMLDYLQLMRDPSCQDSANRQVEVANISAACKACAKELDVPVVVLAQLNRETEKNRNRKPQLADLRESGAIEQDADVVGLLYRVGLKEEEQEAAEAEGILPVNLLIAKQRNGPTGDCEFLFHRERMQFVDKYAGKGAREGEAKAREVLAHPAEEKEPEPAVEWQGGLGIPD